MMKRGLPIYRNKSEHIAEALIGRIMEARLKPCDRFGTEAELLAKYDVSRPTLRESLRMLQARGVVTLRPGPRGGVTVGSPSIDSLAHALSVFLCLRNVPFGAVLKAREAIEPALAYKAALNGTEQDFEDGGVHRPNAVGRRSGRVYPGEPSIPRDCRTGRT